MLGPGHHLSLGSGVALQLVGDEHTRGSTLLLEELAEQALGGLLVAPALDKNIEIGIGGRLAAPPLPHHRAYGSVPRRFDWVKLEQEHRGAQDRGRRNTGC